MLDLCVKGISSPEELSRLREVLECCMGEGYRTVAVNHTFCDVTLTPKQVSTFKPLPVKLTSNQLTLQPKPTQLQQLSRVTLQVSQPRFLQQLNDSSKVLSTYDLVAVRPKSQKVFHSICVQYDYYDIISIDMGEKMPFMLKRNPVYQAIRKGKYFEICYSPLFDSNRKRVCLTNCINLIKATKGKNLIVSSDVSAAILHRSPTDLCSVLVSLGLPRDKALECMGKYPLMCIQQSKNRRIYKGIITLITPEQVQKEETQLNVRRQQKPKQQQSKPKITVGSTFKSRHLLKLQKMKAKLSSKYESSMVSRVPGSEK